MAKEKRLKRSKKYKYAIRIILILFIIIVVYNKVLTMVEEKKYSAPGQLIEIDGHKMHIYSIGQKSDNMPTILMTSGSGTPSAYTEFSNLQQQLATLTRTCVYERPGYGWSEKASTPRDTNQIVEDLHRLLEKSGEKPPYLFIAHSMGAMEVLLYTDRYPEEVEGIVLVDGTSPYKYLYDSEASIPPLGVKFIRVLNKAGFVRIALDFEWIPMLNKRFNSMSKEIKAIDKAMTYKNILNDMVIEEGDSLKTTAEKMYGNLNLEDKPLVLIVADKSMQKLPEWEASQNSLLELSNDSRLMIVDETDHISIVNDCTKEIDEVVKLMIIN